MSRASSIACSGTGFDPFFSMTRPIPAVGRLGTADLLRHDPDAHVLIVAVGALAGAAVAAADLLAGDGLRVSVADPRWLVMYPMAQNNLAICYQNMGDYDRAIAIEKKAIDMDERTGAKVYLLGALRAIGDSYGVNVAARIIRARNAGRAVTDEAVRRGSEIIVMGGPRRVRLATGKRAIFGDTVDFVLRHAPVRVMVAARTAAA